MALKQLPADLDSKRLEKLTKHPCYELVGLDPFGRIVFLCADVRKLREAIDKYTPENPYWKKRK